MKRWIVTLLGEQKYGGYSRIFSEKFQASDFYDNRVGNGYHAIVTEVEIGHAETLKDSRKEEEQRIADIAEAERRAAEGYFPSLPKASPLSVEQTKDIFASIVNNTARRTK